MKNVELKKEMLTWNSRYIISKVKVIHIKAWWYALFHMQDSPDLVLHTEERACFTKQLMTVSEFKLYKECIFSLIKKWINSNGKEHKPQWDKLKINLTVETFGSRV